MTQSMTGYASAESRQSWGRLSWEIRSVNHRYLDFSLRLPEEFRALEAELRKEVSKHIARGKVDAGLRFTREGATAALSVDQERLAAIREAVRSVTESLDQAAAPDPVRVLSMPGVLVEQAPDLQAIREAATTLFSQALKSFDAARASEGARLEAFLLERCERIELIVGQVRARYAQVSGSSIDRLRARAAELKVELDPSRLEQEMVIALQKLDVEEEMSRLLSHVEEIRKALALNESIGRRLDFLMQELNREANTLSSKSQDAELTRLSVDLKVCIEQSREQVQNIE